MLDVLENFVRLRRALSLAHGQRLKPLGLGSKEAVLLRTLAHSGPCSAIELSRATASDPAAVNRTLSGLLKKGLLRQERDPADARRSRLSLTPAKGRRLAAEVQALTEALAALAVQPLTPSERRRFNHDLQRLTEHLNAQPHAGR